MNDADRAGIVAIVTKDVTADLERRFDSEKALLVSTLKIGATVISVVALLLGWVGWSNLQGVKEQAKEEITSATEQYLQKNTGVAEVERTLDKHYASSLVLYHLTHSIEEDLPVSRGHALALSVADAGKLIDIICDDRNEEWMSAGAAAILITATFEPWWPRFERQLAAMISSQRSTGADAAPEGCADLDPALRATIIRLLTPHSDEDFFNRLRPLLESSKEDVDVRSAALDYAASIGPDTVELNRIVQYSKSSNSPIRYSALEYLARWHPQNIELRGWIDKNFRDAVSNSSSVSAAFRIASILFSDTLRGPDFNIDTALRDLRQRALTTMLIANIKFVPGSLKGIDEQDFWVPFRWRPGVDDLDRPIRPSAGRVARSGLEREAFELTYVELINSTGRLPLEKGQEELSRLLNGLMNSKESTSVYVTVNASPDLQLRLSGKNIPLPSPSPKAYIVELLHSPDIPSAHVNSSNTNGRFRLHPIDNTDRIDLNFKTLTVDHITGHLAARMMRTLDRIR